MHDPNADPPETLSDAEEQFKAFLAQNGYPAVIQWVSADDVLIDSKARIHIHPDPAATSKMESRYATGCKQGFGVALVAISATDSLTLATVFVPCDDIEAQYALVPRGLKCVAQVERLPVRVVRNRLRWWLMQFQTRHQDKTWRDLFHLT